MTGGARRFAGSPVKYEGGRPARAAARMGGSVDLVAEIYTVQALYGKARAAAIGALPGLVAPGGTLLVIARATDEEEIPYATRR